MSRPFPRKSSLVKGLACETTSLAGIRLILCVLCLQKLEEVVAMKGYQEVIVETASVLVEACQMYKKAGYKPVDEGVEVKRCDRRLYKILN